jgi:hypothetical protein
VRFARRSRHSRRRRRRSCGRGRSTGSAPAFVSCRDALNWPYASCLRRCHPDSVSDSCHFFSLAWTRPGNTVGRFCAPSRLQRSVSSLTSRAIKCRSGLLRCQRYAARPLMQTHTKDSTLATPCPFGGSAAREAPASSPSQLKYDSSVAGARPLPSCGDLDLVVCEPEKRSEHCRKHAGMEVCRVGF